MKTEKKNDRVVLILSQEEIDVKNIFSSKNKMLSELNKSKSIDDLISILRSLILIAFYRDL
jgi:hypothetical protein